MTRDRKPWVGDQVHDEDTDREAIITDVRRKEGYILRPLHGGSEWTSTTPERLRITVPLEDRDSL
ncbi:hypothetical protein AB0I87_13660 [Streptomyces sp. NPDC049952]|uniref:hypothetical protein n=1 Tax=Streptomyces sp. NPDC049952 TaxID=3156665 RepID=UPI003445F1C1